MSALLNRLSSGAVSCKSHNLARKRVVSSHSTGTCARCSFNSVVVDKDFVDELNKVSNRTLEVLSAGQERDAQRLSEELQGMREYLEDESDVESSRFLRVLQALLDHTLPKEAEALEGVYARAVDRILNQIAGSEWKLVEEGASSTSEEPKFSTWDDVMNEQAARHSGSADPATAGAVVDTTYYRVLEISADAQPAEIKAAYRKLALKLHPDVNPAEDAAQRFSELSNAYDVLSEPTSRELYDRHGAGMGDMRGADAGRGNARDLWDEFKPERRENKHTRARAAAGPRGAADGGAVEASEDSEPQVGDIVEYPLRDIEIADMGDGRTHGVGLLVGRNVDRGDASKLPEELLSLCEVEPLRQEEPDSDRWIADELGISSFARLEDMRSVPVAEFDSRHDVWTIEEELSPGCGGPLLPEEIIL